MRRRFLVLYNREEKAGGLAEMQTVVETAAYYYAASLSIAAFAEV